MSIPRKRFSREEKLEIVKLSLEKGQKVQLLADRFDIPLALLELRFLPKS